jgi:hypothetical protein
MTRFWRVILLIAAALWLAAAGCGGLYDEKDVLSAREHLIDKGKGGDLLQAMDKAHIAQAVLAGAYNSTFNPKEPTDWASAEQNNEMLMEALGRAPSRVIVFPLVRGDEPEFLNLAKRYFAKGARGFTLPHGAPGQRTMSLNDARLQPFYAWCEFSHIPLLIDVDWPRYGGEFEALLRQYPGLTVFGGRMLGLLEELSKLRLLMQRHHNLYLDFSFGSDEERQKAIAAIAAREMEFKRLMAVRYDRFAWGTDVVISRGAGRSVDWLTQYFMDARLYLERPSVKMKFLLNGAPVLTQVRGLDIDRRVLAHLYNLNLKRAIDDQAPKATPSDLPLLLTGLPPRGVYDKDGGQLLMVACATGPANPVENLFSARLKNALTGALTSWREITGVDAPLEVVTVSPLDQWLPKHLGLEKTTRLEVLADADAVSRRLIDQPLTLALLPFGEVAPGMRLLSIDGESPATPYIRDCARRGGPFVRNYFHTYPLLLPLKSTNPPAALSFEPHELRRVLLTGQLLPHETPPGTSAPQQKGQQDPFVEALFKIAPLLQTADLAISAADAPFAETCGPRAPDCLDARWLNALDDAGVDALAVAGANEQAERDSGQLLADHNVRPAGGGAPAEFTVRGMRFAFLADDARKVDWSVAPLVRATAAKVKEGTRTFVYLWADQNAERAAAATRLLAAAGAEATVVLGPLTPAPFAAAPGRPIGFSLGRASAWRETSPALTFFAQFIYYRDRVISVEFTPAAREIDRYDLLHAADLAKAYLTLFPTARSGAK